ncbi:MAG: [FeFe] hydrogenase, group A [Cellulomonadaceae bacterium]|jgi:NADH-quinone oxidoreductase subunit G/[NiFe] hydrogenase diaphorase moiety small subunit|nr:[FeFe] hydrogenase, group A [Cellulomonadaceae bacterium]
MTGITPPKETPDTQFDNTFAAPAYPLLTSATPRSTKFVETRPQLGAGSPRPPKGKMHKPTVIVTIDGHKVEVPVGTSILTAAQMCGRRIPTLCHHPDLPDVGVCRICVVEVEGQWALQAACAYPITRPITINTYSRRVRQARTNVVDLLLSEHYGDCRTCGRSGNCELQDLAQEYASDHNRFGVAESPTRPFDQFGPALIRDMNKCVHCTRCIRTCADLQSVEALGVLNRGDTVTMSTFQHLPISATVCVSCGQCVNRCPTGALMEMDDTNRVWRALEDPSKHVVIQVAPAPRAALGEEFGLAPGTPVTWQMTTALRELGFDGVFDTSFTADLTVIEEVTELLERLHENLVLNDSSRPLPQFTSCSPGWINFLEKRYGRFLAHTSSCKSPQQMFGSLMKTFYAEHAGIDPANIFTVSLMPCTAKKGEAARPEMCSSGYRDVDAVLTTREIGRMIRQNGIHLPHLPASDFDDPFGTATGSGVIFGVSGGVMESALRTAIEILTGAPVEKLFPGAEITPVRGFSGVKEVELTLPKVLGQVPPLLAHRFKDFDWLRGANLKLAVVHGTANAKAVMKDIAEGGAFSKFHFIEFMACPGGCLAGGGQPIPTNAAIRAARAEALYSEDLATGKRGDSVLVGQRRGVRKAHENTAVMAVYEGFLEDGPCGHQSHELLHTNYAARSTFIDMQDAGGRHLHNSTAAYREAAANSALQNAQKSSDRVGAVR